MATPDVTVIGGGVFGLACGFALARRGAKVTLGEAEHIGAGASGGPVGALAPHVPEAWNAKKAFQFESLRASEAFWADVEAVSGMTTGYARIGRVQPIAPDGIARAEARGLGSATLWEGFASWKVVHGDVPGWGIPAAAHVHDTLAARIDPPRACAALAAAVLALGGRIETGAPVSEAPAPALWATGAAGLVTARLGTGVKGQALRLGHDARGLPQVFADGLHIVPHADGTTAIGSTTERDFDDPHATDVALDALLARAVALCPVLAAAPVLARWAGVRPRAATRAPVLGPWPGRPGQFIANGGFKIGFGLAPGVAALMTDLVLDGRDAIPPEFRP